MNINIKIKKNTVICFVLFLFIGLIEWTIGIILSENVNDLDYSFIMKIYEWSIIITVIISIYIWKKNEKTWLSPFIIFFAFFILFNMGQFIMWGGGIHYITKMSSELGVATHIRFMDHYTLMKIIFISLPSLTFFFAGAILSSELININKLETDMQNNDKFRINLKRIGIPILIISYIVAIYDTIKNVSIASTSGYTSLYYGTDMQEANTLVKYISYMFFPSIFATYIGFKCSKKSFVVLTLLILPYIIMNLLIGDRGSWIYFICLWAWCYFRFFDNKVKNHYTNEKKKKKTRILKLIIIATILLCLTTVFYKFREIGFQNITKTDVEEVLKDVRYIFIKPIFEMGQSARCLGIVLQDNLHEIWNGGNTYIAGITAMILPRIKLFFGFYDGYLENWFSQSYLHVKNYGLGFTAIAEAYLNGGKIFYPLYIFAFGFFIGMITKYKNFKNGTINYKLLFISLASTVTLITACRGSIELSLRKWFYGCIFILILNRILSSINKENKN